MITYTRQADGTYLKAGEFAAVPAAVRIQVGDGKPFGGDYTLAQAQAIIEDAIKKNQVNKDVYRILPLEEKPAAASKASTPEQETAIAQLMETSGCSRQDAIKQLRKAARAAGKAPKAPKEPKQPKAKKYNNDDFVCIYQASNNSLDEVCKQTGASRVWAQRVLVRLNVWVKPPKVEKTTPQVELTEQESTRVAEIAAQLVGTPDFVLNEANETADAHTARVRKAAIKQLRKEQRAAAKPAAEPKAPRVLKYSKEDFVRIYLINHSLDDVIAQTGASRVWAQRVLVQKGVWVKPAKPTATETAAPAEPVAAPVVEAPAPAPVAEVPAPAPVVEAPAVPAAAPAPKRVSKLSEAEEATVAQLMSTHNITRDAAIKRMRRAAAK